MSNWIRDWFWNRKVDRCEHDWIDECSPIRGSEDDEDGNGVVAFAIWRYCWRCLLSEELGETRDMALLKSKYRR
jgi:hypothetical protein